jgi:hypothetical protein
LGLREMRYSANSTERGLKPDYISVEGTGPRRPVHPR